jgi:hypothetical protein
MIGFPRALIGGAFALALVGPAFAGDTPAPVQDPAAAAAHEKLMNEQICRNIDDDDTGSHVRHHVCKKRSEWLAQDKHQSNYDPDTGKVVVKE